MQVAGAEAITFGTRITPDFCLILMRTNFLDMGVCLYMLWEKCSKNGAKKEEKRKERQKRQSRRLTLANMQVLTKEKLINCHGF